MKNYKNIFFDLDGTIVNSCEGIVNSLSYALEKIGIKDYDKSVLLKFIGPPLTKSFADNFNICGEKAQEVIALYRENYQSKGIYECSIYDGLEDTLIRLKNAGKNLFVATSKPENFAKKILEHHNLLRYFEKVYGASLDGKINEKEDVINLALAEGIDKSETIMVGDTKYDIIGANVTGIDSLGVLYGFGKKCEFTENNANYIVESTTEIANFLLNIDEQKNVYRQWELKPREKNIVVLVSGGGTNLQALIDAQNSGKIKGGKITCVIASKPDVYALTRAKSNNIDTEILARKNYPDIASYSKAMVDLLIKKKADLVVYAGFMTILDEQVCRAFKHKMMNVHPALIPSFCGKGFYGLHVHEAVLESGVKLTGATVHFVTEVCDGGPIILQKAVEVMNNDTAEVLQKRVMEQAEWNILPNAVALFCENRIKVVGNKVIIE